MWSALPDVLLEDIFGRLSIKERHIASQVCRNWYRIFNSSQVWSTFIVDDITLTKRKFNYYLGYQRVLDHYRTQICFQRVGKHFRKLILTPMENFFNLYEFMKILAYFAEFFEINPLAKVHTLEFTFACHLAHPPEHGPQGENYQELVFGTGGKLLQGLRGLMKQLIGLQSLCLRDLLLDPSDAQYLLDDVAVNCCQTLITLKLINCSKIPYPILHCGVFIHLKKLVITPQHLSDDVLALLSYTSLKDVWIMQTKYTEFCWSVSIKAWQECRKINPRLRVHLIISGRVKKEILWQDFAPVKSIIYDTPYCCVKRDSILMVSELYCQYLEHYAHHRLPRLYTPKSFNKRADKSLVMLCELCPNLRTLIIRDRISTATLLVIATTAQFLQTLIVRKNAIIKRCDWEKRVEWSDEFYQWLKIKSRSYDDSFAEVSKILNKTWFPLSDEEFKRLKPDNT